MRRRIGPVGGLDGLVGRRGGGADQSHCPPCSTHLLSSPCAPDALLPSGVGGRGTGNPNPTWQATTASEAAGGLAARGEQCAAEGLGFSPPSHRWTTIPPFAQRSLPPVPIAEAGTDHPVLSSRLLLFRCSFSCAAAMGEGRRGGGDEGEREGSGERLPLVRSPTRQLCHSSPGSWGTGPARADEERAQRGEMN